MRLLASGHGVSQGGDCLYQWRPTSSIGHCEFKGLAGIDSISQTVQKEARSSQSGGIRRARTDKDVDEVFQRSHVFSELYDFLMRAREILFEVAGVCIAGCS